ncbi:hypothetical protein [Paraburkholderia sp. MM5384-R2]|uniref:hypothetical protein n=1 Tax=Paraburkholderia sp. MM5384-R2 TaxID=2723097 RepID=UPI0016110C51|nr:hypothetical protein [Paraburkholderia sp. MM5384-R2]MBB5502773.1 hypothetical protein [Paraburkholderia sp. MM5384-R2]
MTEVRRYETLTMVSVEWLRWVACCRPATAPTCKLCMTKRKALVGHFLPFANAHAESLERRLHTDN